MVLQLTLKKDGVKMEICSRPNGVKTLSNFGFEFCKN